MCKFQVKHRAMFYHSKTLKHIRANSMFFSAVFYNLIAIVFVLTVQNMFQHCKIIICICLKLFGSQRLQQKCKNRVVFQGDLNDDYAE